MKPSSYNKNWPKKNLGELVNFIDKLYPEGCSLKELSGRTGLTVKNISRIFMHDDMRLRKAEEMADTMGYRLKLFFPERERNGLDYSGYTKRTFPNAGNLSGLAKYLADRNMSINGLCQRIGCSNNVVTNAFNRGDIAISTLYELLTELKIDVIWNFEKKEQQ